MESQSVKLLTEGYLRGWLDFDYKTPFSLVREKYILRWLEQNRFKDVFKAKLQYLAAAFSAQSQQALSDLNRTYEAYSDLALPYPSSRDKIGKTELTPETLQELKKILQEAKANPSKVKVNK